MCHKVPKDPTVCLMCGTMVCLKEDCCKTEVNGEGEYYVQRLSLPYFLRCHDSAE